MQDAAGGNLSSKLMRALLERGDYLESLTHEELAKILPILEAAHDEVLGRIAKTGGAWTREWLEDQAADLDDLYKVAAAKAYKAVKGDLEKLGADEGAWIGTEAGQIAIGISFSTPAPSLLRALVNLPTSIGGSTLEQLFEALAINSREAVYTAIAQGMVEGDTVGDMTRRIRGKVVKRAVWRRDEKGKRRYYPGQYEGGAIEGVSTRQAETLSRTAVMHVANQARDAFYDANADLIKGYQRVETLDLRTCIVCGADDGHVYEPDEPRPSLPEHPDCRGLYVPVLKSWRELGIDADELPEGTRASMDGQVAESVTYADRLAKMTPAERVKALGPGRAALYEKGVKLGDMVKGGQAVPLKELGGGSAMKAARLPTGKASVTIMPTTGAAMSEKTKEYRGGNENETDITGLLKERASFGSDTINLRGKSVDVPESARHIKAEDYYSETFARKMEEKYNDGVRLREAYPDHDMGAAMQKDINSSSPVLDWEVYGSESAPSWDAFFHAGFNQSQKPYLNVGWRFGDAPEAGASLNFAEGRMEKGISFMQVGGEPKNEGTYEMFNGSNVAGVRWFAGWQLIARGTDGEALMVGVRPIK